LALRTWLISIVVIEVEIAHVQVSLAVRQEVSESSARAGQQAANGGQH
jgi:hypothetical protein